MTRKIRTVERARKRLEAEERNAAANATIRDCGHVHGKGVGCQGRVSA